MLDFDWPFFALLMSNGILIGLMYSLIALGFVLVYKATDAINFAQGEFVMIAGLRGRGGARLPTARRCWLAVVVGLAAHDRLRLRARAGGAAAAASAGRWSR